MLLMIDKTLLNNLKILASKEKKRKQFIKRARIKGKITGKSLTKKGNIRITAEKDEDKYNFIVLKSHKDRYSLAERLTNDNYIYAEGVKKLRMIICTKLNQIERVDESRQCRLENFYLGSV